MPKIASQTMLQVRQHGGHDGNNSIGGYQAIGNQRSKGEPSISIVESGSSIDI